MIRIIVFAYCRSAKSHREIRTNKTDKPFERVSSLLLNSLFSVGSSGRSRLGRFRSMLLNATFRLLLTTCETVDDLLNA